MLHDYLSAGILLPNLIFAPAFLSKPAVRNILLLTNGGLLGFWKVPIKFYPDDLPRILSKIKYHNHPKHKNHPGIFLYFHFHIHYAKKY